MMDMQSAIDEMRAIAEDRRREQERESRRYAYRRQRALELLFYIQTHGLMSEDSLGQIMVELEAAEERGIDG